MIALKKVLLIDDESHIRKFLALTVRALGQPAIMEAGDGATGIELYRANHPDLVLLDVNMSGMDGIETLKGILSVDPDANVVMVTSLANRQTVEEAIDNGAIGYIRKDTPKEEILAILNSCLSQE